MFHLNLRVMNVQNNSQISFKSAKIPTLINNKELDNLFMKNKFYKDADGSFNKYLSLKDNFCLMKKTGIHANDMSYKLTLPVTKERKESTISCKNEKFV